MVDPTIPNGPMAGAPRYIADPQMGLYALTALGGDVNLADSAIRDMMSPTEPFDVAKAYKDAGTAWANKFDPTDPNFQDDFAWLTTAGGRAFNRLQGGWSANDVVRRLDADAARMQKTSDYDPIREAAMNMLVSQVRAADMGAKQEQRTPMQRIMQMAGALAEKGVNPMPLVRYYQVSEENQKILDRRQQLQDRIAKMRFQFDADGPTLDGTQVYRNWLRAKQGQKKYQDWLNSVDWRRRMDAQLGSGSTGQ